MTCARHPVVRGPARRHRPIAVAHGLCRAGATPHAFAPLRPYRVLGGAAARASSAVRRPSNRDYARHVPRRSRKPEGPANIQKKALTPAGAAARARGSRN
jgi:hypothetical protein